MSAGYRTVFDVTQAGMQWWIPVLMLAFAIVYLVVGDQVRRSRKEGAQLYGRIFQWVGTIGVAIAIIFFIFKYREYHRAADALRSGRCLVAEGVVTGFSRVAPAGEPIESFTVQAVYFEYDGGWGSATFNTKWNRGFIQEGVRARITYAGHDILRVETAP
jgi:hypothetical protein